MLLERRGEHGEAAGSLDPAPHHDDDATARTQDAMHLSHGGRTVGEELKAKLTQNDVEGSVRERQRAGVRLPPFDGRTAWSRERLGNREHPRIEVGRVDRPALAHLLGRGMSHDSSATGEIEHAVSQFEIREADDAPRPRSEHRGNELALVYLSGAAGYLPLSLIAHRRLTPASHQGRQKPGPDGPQRKSELSA